MSTIASVRAAGRPTVRPLPRRTPLRVVPAAVERSGKGVFAGACMALLAMGLVVLLVLHAQLAQGAYTLHDLELTSGALTDTQHELTQTLDARRNPATLAKRAAELGMVPAASMAFIRLSDGTILGEAQVAKGDKPLIVVTTPKPAVAPPASVPTTAPDATTDPAAGAPTGAPE